jgi:hypothetical protein
MGTGKIIGGILAIIGSALVLLNIISLLLQGAPITDPLFLQNLIISAVILVAAILGLTGKKVGAWITLIVGLLWLVGMLLAIFTSFYYLAPISLFVYLIPVFIIYLGIIELSLIIIGGIILLVSVE